MEMEQTTRFMVRDYFKLLTDGGKMSYHKWIFSNGRYDECSWYVLCFV